MARLSGAPLRSFAPPASLALAASILSLTVLSSLPSPAAAKRSTSRTAPVSETTTSPTPAAQAPTDEATSTPAAGSDGRHRGRGGRDHATPAAPEADAGASVEPTSSTAKERKAIRNGVPHRSKGAKGGTAETTTGASGGPSTTSASGATPFANGQQSRKERERELKRREREARKEEAHRETRKERLTRETREAEETLAREKAASETPVATSPAVEPLATAATATPAAGAAGTTATSSTSALPAVTGESAVAASIGRRAARNRRARRPAQGVAASAPLAFAAAGAPAAKGTGGASPAKHAAHTNRHVKAVAPPSQLVKTVTRIIGVIPTLLWVAIGALAALALAFATSSRLSSRRARRLSRQRRELLEDVGLLQAALLPTLPQRIGPVGTTAAYRPASGPAAGGDFYDVFALADGTLAVIVGDVSGHGREALPHTTLLRFTLRAYLEAGLSPRESLRTAAPVLERQLGGSFATVVLARYEPRARLLTYACAGHPHPIITGMEGEALTACSAPPVGAGRTTGTRQTVVSIPGEAVACFYTDGVIEARVQGELFGIGRVARSVDELGPAATATGLLDSVSAQADEHPDDMAACLLGVQGGAERPSVQVEELELDRRELEHDRVRRFLTAAGVQASEAEAALDMARELVSRDGSALLKVRLDTPTPTVTLTQNNVASLPARAIARSQEVAL